MSELKLDLSVAGPTNPEPELGNPTLEKPTFRTAEVTDLGAIQGTEGGSAAPNLDGAPVTEIKPGDVGMLSLRYVNGEPQLVVSGGRAIPARLKVVDGGGNPVATFTGTAVAAPTGARARVMVVGYPSILPSDATEPPLGAEGEELLLFLPGKN